MLLSNGEWKKSVRAVVVPYMYVCCMNINVKVSYRTLRTIQEVSFVMADFSAYLIYSITLPLWYTRKICDHWYICYDNPTINSTINNQYFSDKFLLF